MSGFVFGFLLLLGVSLLHGQNKSINLVNWERTDSSAYFGSVSYSALNARVTFDEDLFLTRDPFCSRHYEPKTLTCIPCNYSGPSDAAGVCQSEWLNVPSFPGGETLPNCTCSRSFCTGRNLFLDAPPAQVTTRDSSKVALFRYEHSTWDQGFVVEVDPIAEGPFTIYVATKPFFSISTVLAFASSSVPDNFLKVCPSHPMFGAVAETITFFISVSSLTSYSQFDIRVKLLPQLTPEEDLPPLPFIPLSSFIGVPVPISNAPILIPGNVFQGIFPVNLIATLYFLPKCQSITIHAEMISRSSNLTNDFISTFSVIASVVSQQQITDFTFFGPEAVEVLAIQTLQVPLDSSGTVISVCPLPGTEDSFLFLLLNGGIFFDWSILIYARDTASSSYLSRTPIGELSPLMFHQKVKGQVTLTCPCLPDDDCFNVTGFGLRDRVNLISEQYFSSLLYGEGSGSELAPRLGVVINSTLLFRCDDEGVASACGVQRVVPTMEWGNPRLYPLPDSVRLMDELPFSRTPDSLLSVRRKNNGFGIVLSKKMNNAIFFTEERLESCGFFFNGPFQFQSFNWNPVPMFQTFPLNGATKLETECESSTFSVVTQAMTSFGNDIRLASQPSFNGTGPLAGDDDVSASGPAAAAYALLFSDEWQSCENAVNSFTVSNQKTHTLVNSTSCPIYDPNDPCCNIPLQWTQCCLNEGRSVDEVIEVPVSPSTQNIESQCADPECVSTFIQDYVDAYRHAFIDSICLSRGNLRPALFSASTFCEEKWIGDFPYGKFCQVDSDCSLYGEETKCDISNSRCLVAYHIVEDGYLACLLDEWDSFATTAIFFALGQMGYLSDEEFNNPALTITQLREYALNGYQCVSDYGSSSPQRERYTLLPLSTQGQFSCKICTPEYITCLNGYCNFPRQCQKDQVLCDPLLSISSTCALPTQDDLVCNWDNLITEADCNVGSSVCMFCHNFSHCVSLPATSEQECNETPLCLLPNGTVMWDVSESDCNSLGQCSLPCGDRECNSPEECAFSGYCNDQDHIFESVVEIAQEFPPLMGATFGVCVSPISPENQPSCGSRRNSVSSDLTTFTSLDFESSRGCVTFSQCLAPYSLNGGLEYYPFFCSPSPSNPVDCVTQFNGTWLPLPIRTKDQCENPLGFPPEDAPGYCDISTTEERVPFLARKNASDCLACGGIPTPPSQWVGGIWSSGVPRSATFQSAEMKAEYHYVNDSISFSRLYDLFENAVLNFDSFINANAYSCLIEPFIPINNQVSCKCDVNESATAEQEQSEICSSTATEFDLGSIWFCPEENLTVGSSAGVIKSVGEFVLGNVCKFSLIHLASTTIFTGNHERKSITVFGDPNDLDPLPVRNEKGASVGYVLDNGISFGVNETLQSEYDNVIQVLIAFDMSNYNSNQQNNIPENYVLDFGIEVTNTSQKFIKDEIELRPLNAVGPTLGKEIGSFSGNIVAEGYWVAPFSSPSLTRIFPIARKSDWESVGTDNLLSEGEQVMMGVFCGLYGLASLFCIALLISISVRTVLTLSNSALFFFITFAFMLRTVLTALFASNHLESATTGYYWLVEPPSFFLLSVLTILILSFAFCVKTVEGVAIDHLFKSYWIKWGLVQVSLYIVLLIVLILLSTLETKDETTTSCFGRFATVEENQTVEYIRIAYHSFILFLALIGALIVFRLGYELNISLNTESKRVLVLSFLSGVSIVCTSLLWVIYSGLNGSSPYFIIPLFFTEVPPLLAICYLVLPKTQKSSPSSFLPTTTII